MEPTVNFSLSYVEVQQIFNLEPFGIGTFARQVRNELDAFSFAVHSRLVNVRKKPDCAVCQLPRKLYKRADKQNNAYQGLFWKCLTRPGVQLCSMQAVTQNTWFENVHIPWLKALELAVHWFFRTPVTSAAGQVGVSNECAVDWYSYCREVCYTIVSKLDICIGGAGFHVEIDESHLFRRKYRQGRVLAHEDVWVFGGICRETKEVFVEVVPDRSGNTLWPIIQQRIAPGSIIMTDCARVYNSLHEPRRGGYEHYQVNHRQNFVDPNNRSVYTNTVERQWGIIKGKLSGKLDDQQMDMYLGEYMYRHMYLKVSTDRERRTQGIQFRTFINDVIKVYPGPGQEQVF